MASLGVTELQVRILSEVNYVNNRVMVLTQYNQSIEVDASFLPKGSGLPKPGERWVCERKFSRWVLTSPIGLSQPAVIAGDRGSDVTSILSQILTALASHDIVVDVTTNAPSDDDPIDMSPVDPDPDPGTDGYTNDEPSFGDDEYVPDRQDVVATQTPKPSDPAEVKAHKNDKDPDQPDESAKRYSHLTVVSYNQRFGITPPVAISDYKKFDQTRADVVMLCEMNTTERSEAVAGRPDGWGVWRPANTGRESNIMWREETVRSLDTGVIVYDASAPYGPRCLTWAKLQHTVSGVVFYAAMTHTTPWAAFRANFSTAKPGPWVEHWKIQMSNLPGAVSQLKGAPVFVGADWNCDFRADLRQRNPGMPFRIFASVGFHSNWEVLGLPPDGHGSIGTHGSIFDGIYFRPEVPGQIKMVSTKIGLGYHSDHRPVFLNCQVKNSVAQEGKSKKPKADKTHRKKSESAPAVKSGGKATGKATGSGKTNSGRQAPAKSGGSGGKKR